MMMLTLESPRFQFGMCSSHYYFPAALEILKKNRDLFAKFIEHKIHIDKAEEVRRGLG